MKKGCSAVFALNNLFCRLIFVKKYSSNLTPHMTPCYHSFREELEERKKLMKTLDEYMSLPYKMELIPDPDESGFIVSFPELPGCLTSGETAEEALKNARDAKESWISAALEDHIEIPEPDEDRVYSGQFKLRIPKSLHRSLAEHSRREGISMNQYCLFLLTKNDTSFQ